MGSEAVSAAVGARRRAVMDDLWSELERLTSLCERTGAEMAAAGGVVSGPPPAYSRPPPPQLHRPCAPPEGGDAARPAGLALLDSLGAPQPPQRAAEVVSSAHSHQGGQPHPTAAGSPYQPHSAAGHRPPPPAVSQYQPVPAVSRYQPAPAVGLYQPEPADNQQPAPPGHHQPAPAVSLYQPVASVSGYQPAPTVSQYHNVPSVSQHQPAQTVGYHQPASPVSQYQPPTVSQYQPPPSTSYYQPVSVVNRQQPASALCHQHSSPAVMQHQFAPAVSQHQPLPAVSQHQTAPAVTQHQVTPPAASQQHFTPVTSQQPLTPAGSRQQLATPTPTPTPPLESATERTRPNRAGRLAHLFFGRRLEQSAAPRRDAPAPPRPESPAAGRQQTAGEPPPRPARPARLSGAGRAPGQPERTADPASGGRQPVQPPGTGRSQGADRSDTHSWPRPAPGEPAGGEQRQAQPRPPERPARREVRQRGHPNGSSEPWQPRQPPPPPPPPDSRKLLEEERRQHNETRLQLAAVQQLLYQEQQQLQQERQLLIQEQQQHQHTRQQLEMSQQAAEAARQALRQAQQQVAANAVLRAEFVRASSAAASELDRLQERLREREIQLGELREQLHAVRRLQMAEPPPPDEVRVSHHQPEHDRRAGSLPGRPAPPPRPAEALFNQLVQNRYQSDSLPGQPVSLRSSERDARAMSSSLSHFGSKSSLAQSLTGSSKSAESHKAFDNYYEMSNADDKCSLEETALNKHGFGTQQQQQNSSEKSRKSKTNMIRMRGTGCKQKTSTMRQMLNKVFGTKQAKKATYNLSSSPIQKTRSETGLFRGGEQPRGCSTPLAASGAAPRSFSLQNLASSGSAGRLSYLHSSHEEVYEDVTDSEWECATEDEQDGSPIYINMEFHNGCLVPKANKLIGPKMK